MTPERAKEILPLVQAAAEGKTIQYRCEDGGDWADHDNVLFTGPIECYRIKPEAREWKACVWTDDLRNESALIGRICAYDEGDENDRRYEIVYVREIPNPVEK